MLDRSATRKLLAGPIGLLLSVTLPLPGAMATELSDDILLPILANGKMGYGNRTGQIVIAPQFDYADDFSEGLAKIGMIDSTATGQEPVRFDELEWRHNEESHWGHYTPDMVTRFGPDALRYA